MVFRSRGRADQTVNRKTEGSVRARESFVWSLNSSPTLKGTTTRWPKQGVGKRNEVTLEWTRLLPFQSSTNFTPVSLEKDVLTRFHWNGMSCVSARCYVVYLLSRWGADRQPLPVQDGVRGVGHPGSISHRLWWEGLTVPKVGRAVAQGGKRSEGQRRSDPVFAGRVIDLAWLILACRLPWRDFVDVAFFLNGVTCLTWLGFFDSAQLICQVLVVWTRTSVSVA